MFNSFLFVPLGVHSRTPLVSVKFPDLFFFFLEDECMMRRGLHLPKNKQGAETDESGHCY